MKVHASKEEIEGAPAWLTSFLNAAWAPPDSRGQRIPLAPFEDIEQIAGELGSQLDSLRQLPHVRTSHFGFAMDADGGHFAQYAFWKDRTAEIADGLAAAWTRRATLAHCQTCGNLMEPAKGKPARFCSAACRVSAHRKAG